MSLAVENKQEYAELLANVLPHIIHTEQENERCSAALKDLLRQSKRTRAKAHGRTFDAPDRRL